MYLEGGQYCDGATIVGCVIRGVYVHFDYCTLLKVMLPTSVHTMHQPNYSLKFA